MQLSFIKRKKNMRINGKLFGKKLSLFLGLYFPLKINLLAQNKSVSSNAHFLVLFLHLFYSILVVFLVHHQISCSLLSYGLLYMLSSPKFDFLQKCLLMGVRLNQLFFSIALKVNLSIFQTSFAKKCLKIL